MAMPVIQGLKTESERFAGAEDTIVSKLLCKTVKLYKQEHLTF